MVWVRVWIMVMVRSCSRVHRLVGHVSNICKNELVALDFLHIHINPLGSLKLSRGLDWVRFMVGFDFTSPKPNGRYRASATASTIQNQPHFLDDAVLYSMISGS